MKLVRFDDDSGYALLNDEGLCFAIKGCGDWWEAPCLVDLSGHSLGFFYDDVPEEQADAMIADYCAWRLTR